MSNNPGGSQKSLELRNLNIVNIYEVMVLTLSFLFMC